MTEYTSEEEQAAAEQFNKREENTTVDESANSDREEGLVEMRFTQLGNIISGENRDDSALSTAVGLLQKLGSYRGPDGTLGYSMTQLADAVREEMQQAYQLELRDEHTTVDGVKQRLLEKIPELAGKQALSFFASAISINARLKANGRI